jgi:hypothetical protein
MLAGSESCDDRDEAATLWHAECDVVLAPRGALGVHAKKKDRIPRQAYDVRHQSDANWT